MALTSSQCSIESLSARIAPLRQRLAMHPLYSQIKKPEHLSRFMESHVFAVWDFMSLLKALQAGLTCVTVPWTPTVWPESRRFVNEIVLGEESDLYKGRSISHFELYLEAMNEAGADTGPVEGLLQHLLDKPAAELKNFPVEYHLPKQISMPAAARNFVSSTFQLIATGDLHRMAAAFTFGREDLIPDLFRGLVRDLNARFGGRYSLLIWYLERHIEVDGEDHGPLALRMVTDLCGTDEKLWAEAADAAEVALKARLTLWDTIAAEL